MVQMLADENWNVVGKDSVSTVALRRESCLQQLHEHLLAQLMNLHKLIERIK